MGMVMAHNNPELGQGAHMTEQDTNLYMVAKYF